MVSFVDLFLNDLACDIHRDTADLILDLIDRFLFLLCDIRFRFSANAGSLLLCLPNSLIRFDLSLFLGTLDDLRGFRSGVCKSFFVLYFQAICFFFGFPGFSDLQEYSGQEYGS